MTFWASKMLSSSSGSVGYWTRFLDSGRIWIRAWYRSAANISGVSNSLEWEDWMEGMNGRSGWRNGRSGWRNEWMEWVNESEFTRVIAAPRNVWHLKFSGMGGMNEWTEWINEGRNEWSESMNLNSRVLSQRREHVRRFEFEWNEWMEGMNEWTEWINEGRNGVNEWSEWVNEWMHEWKDEWMRKWMNEWMEQMNDTMVPCMSTIFMTKQLHNNNFLQPHLIPLVSRDRILRAERHDLWTGGGGWEDWSLRTKRSLIRRLSSTLSSGKAKLWTKGVMGGGKKGRIVSKTKPELFFPESYLELRKELDWKSSAKLYLIYKTIS